MIATLFLMIKFGIHFARKWQKHQQDKKEEEKVKRLNTETVFPSFYL